MAAGDGLEAAYAQGRSLVRPGLALRRIVAGIISAGEVSKPA